MGKIKILYNKEIGVKSESKEPKNEKETARLENWSYREKKAAELLDTKFKK